MAEPLTDAQLDALLQRYVPGSMLDSAGTAELVEQCQRLRMERDQVVLDATFLSECAAKLMHGGDALIEEVVENAHDDLQRQLRRTFDMLRLSDVMGRYVPGEPRETVEVRHG